MADTPLVKVNARGLGVELDLRYASDDNICGRPLYREGVGLWLHRDAMRLLGEASKVARSKDFMLLVYDGYRPQRVQRALWEQCPDARYVANPETGSLHTRGIAVDLTLVRQEGRAGERVALDMGAEFDEMREVAHWDAYEKGLISQAQQGCRWELRGVMESVGFETIATEWWHYQLSPGDGGVARYPLIAEHLDHPLTHPDLLAEVG